MSTLSTIFNAELKSFMLPSFPSRSYVSKIMSEMLLTQSNSSVNSFPFNNNSTLKHFVLLVEHTLFTLVCFVLLFQGQFRLMWVELPQIKQLQQFFDQWFFAHIVDISFSGLPFWVVISFARIWSWDGSSCSVS